MAATKGIDLRVRVSSDGTLKIITQDLEKFNAGASKATTKAKTLSQSVNQTKRNLEGVAKRSGSAGKDFSRQAQGMGGLVAAYATVAANVFALSSAFLVLRRTADLSSMIKSAEDFSNRYGLSVTSITKQIQKATGGALSFAEALPTINKAISAGVPIEKMEALAVAATKAAQTFGGSATEALNRFISASQRGRVEIIQTLGVVIKTEDAYERYGASIGKTALELSAFDRQQAILNATIEASQSVFDGINIDPNPFQQLLVTIMDLKDVVGVFITDALTPFFKSFNQSKAAAAALIALVIGIVGKRIFPALGDQLVELQKKSFAATKNASVELKKVSTNQTRSILQNGIKQNKLTKDQLLQRDKLFKTFYGESLVNHKSFGKSILDENKRVNAAILNEQRSALTKEINIRKKLKTGGTGTKGVAFRGISDQALENQRNRLILLTKETEHARAATVKLTMAERAKSRAFRESAAAITVATAKMRADFIAFRAQITTGFQRSFTLTQTNFITSVKLMTRSWGNFVRFAIISSRGASFAFAAFGRAVGRTAGLIAGAFIKAISIFSSLTLVVSLGLLIWEKFGDKIRGITPAQRKIIEATDDFTERMEESNKVLSEGIRLWGDKAPTALKDFVDSFTFVAGTFETITNAITQFNKQAIEGLGGFTLEGVVKELERAQQVQDELRKEVSVAENVNTIPFLRLFINEAPEAKEKLEKVNIAIVNINSTIDELGKGKILNPLISQFEKASGFANTLGIDLTKILQNSAKSFDALRGEIDYTDILTLKFLASIQKWDEFKDKVKSIKEEYNLTGVELFKLQQILTNFFSTAAGEVTGLGRTASSSLKQLQEVGANFNTFILGIDKLKSQKSPFKELFGFTINAENALNDLVETQEVLSSTPLKQAFETGEIRGDLESILLLLGDEVKTVGQAKEAAKKLKEEFAAQLQLQLLGTKKLKAGSLELANIKNREIKSDKERIAQVVDGTNQEIINNRMRQDMASSTLKASERVLEIGKRTKKLSTEEIESQELGIDILKRELDALDEKERRLFKFTKARLEELKLQEEIVNNLKSRFNLGIKLANIDKSLGGNLGDILSYNKDIYQAKKQILRLDIELINIKLTRMKVLEQEGPLLERQTDEEKAKLIVLERQAEALERQQESRLALEEQQAGRLIFSERGIDLTAHFFRRALEAEIPKLKSTFEVLGKGLADAMFSTSEAIVELLITGSKNLTHAIKEAIKSDLRKAFADTINNAIKGNLTGLTGKISDIFKSKETKSQEVADNAAAERTANIAAAEHASQVTANNTIPTISTTLDNQLAKQEVTNTKLDAINTSIMNSCACSAAEQAKIPALSITTKTESASGNANAGAALANMFPETNSKLDTLIATNKEGNNTAEIAAESNKAGLGMLVQGFQGLLSTVGLGGDSAGGQAIAGIASSAFSAWLGANYANGGIMKQPRHLAAGALTSGPELALIGEGKNNEAVVPLPNNREIPVDLKGAQGDTIQIEQNFDFRNADASAVVQLRAEARNIQARTFNQVFTEINKGGKYAKMVGRR